MNDDKVLKMLTVLPNSEYNGISLTALAIGVTPREARRYLHTLIVYNDRLKSDFHMINEVSAENSSNALNNVRQNESNILDRNR